MRTFSFCGTIEYMSPELIKGGNEGHGFSVDWWSVGVLTYELLTGASPFTVDGERNTQAEISKRILRNQPPIPEHLSSEARDFILKLLVKDPTKRLGGGQSDASQLKSHPFLATINWTLLAQRKLKAPFRPKIKHELDVSNFADEFTSMPPHALVASSNNQISTTSSSTIHEDEEDDYYESSSEDDDELEDEDEEETDLLNHRLIKKSRRELHQVSSDTLIKLTKEYTLKKANNDNRQQDDNFVKQQLLNQDQKVFSHQLISNNSVIVTTNNNDDDNNVNSNRSNIIDKSYSCINTGQKQQVFLIMNPSKKQLSLDTSLHHKSKDLSFNFQKQFVLKKHTASSLNVKVNNIIRESSNNQASSMANDNRTNDESSSSSNQSATMKQYYNGVHFSKLFKGYSYTNPKAIEWLKQQDKKTNKNTSISRVRNSLKLAELPDSCSHVFFNTASRSSSSSLSKYVNYIDHSFKSTSNVFNEFAAQKVSAAKAIPIDNVTTLDDQDDQLDYNGLVDNYHNGNVAKKSLSYKSKPVAFTIGDGEDLTAAVRSATANNNKTSPERLVATKRRLSPQRLVVTKRKPTIELMYESSDSNRFIQATKLNHRHISPSKLGSIQFDPRCDFFKIYHLVHPLNSKRDLLGEGAYSICKRCVHKETGKEYAVKVMRRCPETSREIEMLHRCQGHPNIVRLYNVFQDQYNTYLVCELLKGGELLTRIQKKRHLMTEQEVCRLFRSLVSIVYYLHSQRIVHRDLKPENLLFVDTSPASELKLIDFGFARELPEIDSGISMRSPCITLDYCAPEVLNQVMLNNSSSSYDGISTTSSESSPMNPTGGYDESCDLWSMGVILYTMLSGRLPFRDPATARPLGPINVDNLCPINFSGPEWSAISQTPKDIIRGLLEPDPSKRLTIEQLAHFC